MCEDEDVDDVEDDADDADGEGKVTVHRLVELLIQWSVNIQENNEEKSKITKKKVKSLKKK